MHKQPLVAPPATPLSVDGHQDVGFQPTSLDHVSLDLDTPDLRVMAMMLREALLGLGRVRSELAELKRQQEHLLGSGGRVSGSTSNRTDTLATGRPGGRVGFETAFDDVLACLADEDMAYAPRVDRAPAVDWAEWERTTKARIRGSATVRSVTTGATNPVTGIA